MIMTNPLKKINRANILFFLSIIGPGIITANVDNDAGGIATYSVAGAQYGYTLLWSLIPMLVILILIQEMVARLGVVTGKGLSDLIREQYGVKVTFYTMLALLITNFGNITAEFAGLAASLEIFGVSRYISVPLAAAAVWYLVVWGNYRVVEKVFLFACTVYLSYVVSGFMANPPWGDVLMAMVKPTFQMESSYVFMLMGIIGTTIAPWMQFYQQASIVEKEIHVKDYRYVRWDVVVGCFFAVIVVFFIYGCLRGDPACQRHPGQDGGRRCGGPGSACGEVRRYPLCHRPGQCLPVCCLHSASQYGLQHL
jgi:NRAMP (natural resistance-associated macrophage protein)-like metal ion transporter